MSKFVLVPKEPTQEMLDAAWLNTASASPEEHMAGALGDVRAVHDHKMRRRYAAMLAAIPVQS